MSAGSPINQGIIPLPRDIDIRIDINRPQQESARDMSLLVFLTPNVDLPPNNGRSVIASTMEGLLSSVGGALPEDTVWWATNAWASQAPRAPRMAIGRVFTTPVPAQLMASQITDYTMISAITDGSFSITVTDSDGSPTALEVTGVDLTGVQNVAGIVSAINSALTTASITQISSIEDYGGRIVISASSPMTTISYASTPLSGTDISVMLNLTQDSGAQKWDAYTPQGIISEFQLVQQALSSIGASAFCVALDRQYRDTTDQKLIADYVEANPFQLAATLETNSPLAYDASDTTNIGSYVHDKNYRSSSVTYSSHPQEYSEIAYIQSMLSTDYVGGKTKDAMFKSASGITPESITETQLQVLQSRNINIYTRVGTIDAYRYGTQGADTWFSDSYYGWSNLREYLSVSVSNGFHRRPKTPLTRQGQTEVVGDIGVVMNMFVLNEFLADRAEQDPTLSAPYVTKKAYSINPSPIYNSDRVSRTLAPIAIIAYEAGSIHKAIIGITAYN